MLLFGAVMGVPVLGVNYDPKVKSNIKELGIGECLEIDELTTEAGLRKADKFFGDIESIKEKMPPKIEERRKLAIQNANAASELMRK